MIMAGLILIFGSIKFEHLISKYNPQMSSYLEDVPENEKFTINEKGFRIAIAIEDYYEPKQLKNDPRYVKWLFRLWGKKDG